MALFRVALMMFVLLAFSGVAFAEDDWESLGEIDGVKVWKKEVPGTDLFAFRGEVVADVHIGRLITVFANPSKRSEWVARWKDSKTLDQTPMSEEYWIQFDTPFPVTNRDYVLRSDIKHDAAEGVFVCNIESVVRKDVPENDCCVRAQANSTYYRFTAIKGDTPRTRMIVEVHTDPKGMLPDWLVNLIQKKWPSDTLNGLVTAALEPAVGVHPKFVGWHGEEVAQ